MAQRLTQQRQIYFGVESTEGSEVFGLPASALSVTNLTLGPDRTLNPRAFVGQFGRFAGNMGAQMDPGLSFTVQLVPGVGATNVPAIDALLANVLAPSVTAGAAGGTTISAATSASSFSLTSLTGYGANNGPGCGIAVETAVAGVYEAGWISPTWNAANPVILAQPLSFTPGVGKNVKQSVNYRPQNSGHNSLSFQIYLDSGDEISFVGCKGSVKLDVPALGAIPTLTFNFKAMYWAFNARANPGPTYDTTTPQPSFRFKIDQNVTADVKMANWALGQSIARKMTQSASLTGNGPNYGTFAQLVTNRALRGSLQAYDVDDSQYASWQAGTENALSHQFGSAPTAMAAYQIPKAQRIDVGYGDDNGLTTDQVYFAGNIVSGADEIRLAFL